MGNGDKKKKSKARGEERERDVLQAAQNVAGSSFSAPSENTSRSLHCNELSKECGISEQSRGGDFFLAYL